MPWIRRTSFACALSACLALTPIVTTAAEKSASAASGPALSSITIENFGQVSPTYYRGSQPDLTDYTDLAKLGVKTVIDLQQDGKAIERQLVESAGMKFYRIPMTTRTAPTAEELSLFLNLVNDAANQPPGSGGDEVFDIIGPTGCGLAIGNHGAATFVAAFFQDA